MPILDDYAAFYKKLDIDYKNLPIIYLEFDWVYSIDKSVLRFLKIVAKDVNGDILKHTLSPFLNYSSNTLVHSVLDLSGISEDVSDLELELYLESKNNSKIFNMKNFKIYVGK